MCVYIYIYRIYRIYVMGEFSASPLPLLTCTNPFAVSAGSKIMGSLKSLPSTIARLYSDSPWRMRITC